MISMTGFAYREQVKEDISLSVEIRGYNSRFLDIQVNTPPWLSHLEPAIRGQIGSICGRGKVEVFIRVREQNAPLNISVNTAAAAAYMNAVSALADGLGINEKLSMAALIGMEGVLDVEKNRDDERYWNVIEPVLREAVCFFHAERVREGKQTEGDILSHITILEESVELIGSHIPSLETSIKENLRSRFAELLGDKIDENRVLAETAVLLMKYTISEELARLSVHLKEFRLELERNPSPGKKLDFLSQEMNREINTIGSKTPVLEVSRAVVEMKNALENIREQLRNVE